MRWQAQALRVDDAGALPGLGRLAGLVRSTTTPEFAGVTFHEVLCRSALSKVPDASRMPFRWTINPYRGCVHRCRYCFARKTHEYLELDAGDDFDRQIVVKVNLVDVLRRELARPSWDRSHVALGTNTDPYQRPEGRYQLMPGVIRALAASGTPFSVLTKGTLMRRDLPLLAAAARDVGVGTAVSIALLDPVLQQSVEPGTPVPRARLDLVRAVRDAGLPCSVLVAPVLPGLTDSDEQLDELLGQIASAGAQRASVMALHLRPGAREWFLGWLAAEHPALVPRYDELYRRGSYVRRDYADDLRARVRPLLRRHGLEASRHRASTEGVAPSAPAAAELTEPRAATLF